MEVSVIIPVYNAEKNLRRCVDSVLNQSFADCEVLLIDDGSTDGSGALCDAYARRYARDRALHKKNGGVSSACNLGVENARGKYLMFCDSDDYAEPDWIETLHMWAQRHPHAFVFSAFFETDGGGDRTVRLEGFPDGAQIPVAASPQSIREDPIFALECRATDLWALMHDRPEERLPGREFTEKFIRV